MVPKTPVTPKQHSHGDPMASGKKSGMPRCAQYDGKHRRSNAVASPIDTVRSHRTQNDGTHFEYAQNKPPGLAIPGHS